MAEGSFSKLFMASAIGLAEAPSNDVYRFCGFDNSSSPWGDIPPDYVPYSPENDDRISLAVVKVCTGETDRLLVPITPDAAIAGAADDRCYYVAIGREGFTVNTVQCRLVFRDGSAKVLQRAVTVKSELVARFKSVRFTHRMLTPENVDALFWSPIRRESIAHNDRLILSATQFPVNTGLRHGAFYRNLHGGFKQDTTSWRINKSNFSTLPPEELSVLVAVASAPGAQVGSFASVIPLEKDTVNRHCFLTIIRDTGSFEVSVVLFRISMNDHVFQHPVLLPGYVFPAGFVLRSRVLDDVSRRSLLLEPLQAYWAGGFQAPSVVGMLRGIVCVENADLILKQMPIPETSLMAVLAGIALVCSVGGRREMLVPVVGPDPMQPDAPVQFISIVRRLRMVSLAVVILDSFGVVQVASFDLPDRMKNSCLLADVSFVHRESDHLAIRTMCFVPVFAGWSAQIASLAFVKYSGSGFSAVPSVEGYYPHAPVVIPKLISFVDSLKRAIEFAVRVMVVEKDRKCFLISPTYGGVEFIIVVRRDAKLMLLHLTADGRAPLVVRAVEYGKLASTPLGVHMAYGVSFQTSDLRELFDRVAFDYWREVSRVNPFNWQERRIALAMGTHPSLARNSFIRLLDDHLIRMISQMAIYR